MRDDESVPALHAASSTSTGACFDSYVSTKLGESYGPPMSGMKQSGDCLDILGQLPFLRLCTQISCIFSMPSSSSEAEILSRLKVGLVRLSSSFPWVAGKVVNEGASKHCSGTFLIEPFEESVRLVVKDLRSDVTAPTMVSLIGAGFPINMLDEDVVAPFPTVPKFAMDVDLAPVFALQATFISGGVVLTFVGQHNAMDMIGLGQLMFLFSKACRGEAFTDEELKTGNLLRRDLIRFFDDTYRPGPEIALQMVTPVESDSHQVLIPSGPSSAPSAVAHWHTIIFSAASLASLKSLAEQSITPPDYISTDDALTAFIWQAIIRARVPRLQASNKSTSTFGRSVDVRRYLSIPLTYPGLVTNMVYLTRTMNDLIEEPLGSVAADLRTAVDPKTSSLEFSTKALATQLNRLSDKSLISFGATLDLSMDLMLSSWAKVRCFELDYGLALGLPVAVRRPQFTPFESLVYLFPKAADGEITVAACLRDEDILRLKADEKFRKYGRFVG